MDQHELELILVAIPGVVAIIALLKLYYTSRRYRIK